MNHVCGYYRSYIWSKTHVSMISNTYVIPQGLLSLREAQCGLWSLRSSSLLNSITRILRNLWFKYLEVIVLAIFFACFRLLTIISQRRQHWMSPLWSWTSHFVPQKYRCSDPECYVPRCDLGLLEEVPLLDRLASTQSNASQNSFSTGTLFKAFWIHPQRLSPATMPYSRLFETASMMSSAPVVRGFPPWPSSSSCSTLPADAIPLRSFPDALVLIPANKKENIWCYHYNMIFP